MWPALRPPFGITRNNVPVAAHPLLDPIDSGVRFNAVFEQYEAAIAAGATLDELYRWDNGEYPPWFMANVIAWYRGHSLVKVSGEDAVARKMKADAKKRKR